MTSSPTNPANPAHDDAPQPLGALTLAPGVTVPRSALRFSASRSSGPGGQNVNKRSTKVELRVALQDLPLRPPAIHRLAALAGKRLLLEDVDPAPPAPVEPGAPAPPPPPPRGDLLIISDEERSQPRNKAACLERLRALLIEAMAQPKVRRKTRPTRSSKERRLDAKRRASETKRRRASNDD